MVSRRQPALGRFVRQRSSVDDDLTARGIAHTFSLARYRLHWQTMRLIDEHATGDCLDSGSGRSPFKLALARRCTGVLSVDVEDMGPEIDLVADIQALDETAADSFDTVLCTQVLEHVPRPWDAMGEIHRVLRPGGKVILSVPHLSALHEEPNDYYRYTRYGLEELCRKAGLEVIEIASAGGLLAFLSHGFSYVLLSSMWRLPGLRWLTWVSNYVLLVRLLEPVDRLLGMAERYPCNYVVLAEKIEGTG